MILRFLILLILSLSISSELVAQPTEREWRDKPMNRLMFGVMGNASLNIHRGTLTTTEGILECGRFENATTLGWTAGNTVNIPMTSELSVSPHVYFHNANAVFSALNSVTPLVSIGNGNTVPMSSTHDLQVSLHYLMVDIPVRYFLNKRTFLSAGVSFGTPVNSSFEQSERITSPTGLTFLDGTTTRKIFAGQFSDTQGASSTSPLRVGAIASVGYILPLSESFALTAESGFQFGITSVLQGNSWSLHSLRGGIGLSYILEPAAVPEPVIEKKVEVPPPPPPPVKIAAPLATVDVFNVERGRQADYAEITINQTIAVDVLPLLPYIFFQQSSSTIGNTYHKLDAASAVEFRESQLSNDQMAVYYDVLNIIGARLKSIPDATITVTGCIETEDELRTKGLARKRAQDVARYLTEVWGIAANRIRIKRTMLPAYPSVQSIADGRNENRRVEIEASDKRILAPVFIRSTVTSTSPDTLRVQPEIVYGGDIATTDYQIQDNSGSVLWTSREKGSPTMSIATSQLRFESLQGNSPLRVAITSTSDDNRTTSAARVIPVRRTYSSSRKNMTTVRDSVIERYSMILFNFDRSSTIETNDQVLSLIRSRIRTTSSVTIEGMTDYIGRAKNNKRLSEFRATAVAQGITSFIKPAHVASCGLGEVDLYDNTTPEGRFYNRRVAIEIATPRDLNLDSEESK